MVALWTTYNIITLYLLTYYWIHVGDEECIYCTSTSDCYVVLVPAGRLTWTANMNAIHPSKGQKITETMETNSVQIEGGDGFERSVLKS